VTKKMKITIDSMQAETIIRDVGAASRLRRLRKAETEVRDAAKPKTFAGRGVTLRQAEAEIAGKQPRDPRCMWNEMVVDRPKSKPSQKTRDQRLAAEIARAVRR
jgi:hypothetical protein